MCEAHCGLKGDMSCRQTARVVCWTGRLIVCDMGQAGMVGGDGKTIGSLARGKSASLSQWVPICMSGPFVCVCMFSHYPSSEYVFVGLNSFLRAYLCVLSIILSCAQAPVDSH